MNISEQLKQLRLTRFEGSTKAMADAIGMSRNQLANYIGGASASPKMIQRIADAIDVDRDWLLTGTGRADERPTAKQLLDIIESQQRTIEHLAALIK